MKLCVPAEVLEQHLVVLGKTGAGKSSALRHIVEHLLRQKKRVCIIDPKGDWWGLKSSADGKSAGFPVIAFGDFKEARASDVPINQSSGKHVAELITSGNRPCIIGFRGWMTAHMVKFWIDFASGIFNANEGELYVVIDECHNFAPKGKIMDPEAGKCLHWSNRLMSEGRGLGIVCLIASQRPQKVHNDTLTSCETLVAMRVIHKADRDAVKDWIDGNGDPAKGKEVLDSLAGMARGEAFVWSPEAGFGPERVKFPMFTTFDSFAPPQLQKKVSGAGWADVDLAAVKEKLSKVIEEAKANDPTELRAEVARLKRELRDAEQKAAKDTKVEVKVKEVAAVPAGAVREMTAMNKKLRDMQMELAGMCGAIARFNSELDKISKTKTPFAWPKPPSTPPRREVPPPPAKSNIEDGNGLPATPGAGEMKILAAIAQFGEVTREQLTVNTGYKRSSRDAFLQRLRSRGLIEDGGDGIRPTQAGIDALGDRYEPLPTGDALREYWFGRLPEGERKLFEILVNAYPDAVDRDELSERTGYKRSSRDAFLQRLSSRMLVRKEGRGAVRASENLFG